MKIWHWLFGGPSTIEDHEAKCDKCGYCDDEANICQTCRRTICDGCMGDFIAGQCIDCSTDIDEEQ